jgi:hypothetical protein
LVKIRILKRSTINNTGVPNLPNVNTNHNSNQNQNQNHIRPLSVENGSTKHSNSKLFNNNDNKTNQFSTTNSNSNANFSYDDKKIKPFLTDTTTTTTATLNNSKNKDVQQEEFGLSVTKLDNNKSDDNTKQIANRSSNQQPPQVNRRQKGQIIDFRSMINEATKLSAEDGGDNNNTVKLQKQSILFSHFKSLNVNSNSNRIID